MLKWLLRVANGILSLTVTVILLTAAVYAGYALWDNGQIYASAENPLAELAPSRGMGENIMKQEEKTETETLTQTESAAPESNTAAEETNREATKTEKNPSGEPGSEVPVEQAEKEDPEEETELGKLFRQLKEVNKDIGAWITMPGTAIDYPVVRGSNNIQYVSTDIYGNFAIVGSIFLDSRNQTDYSDTYNLLYGHNMSEHRMFSDVNLYKDEKFFQENQKGYIYFPSGAHWLQSVSVIVTPASDSWMLNPQSWSEIESEKILELAQTNAMFVSEKGMEALKAKLEAGERPCLVALSTCSNEYTDARTILLTLMDP